MFWKQKGGMKPLSKAAVCCIDPAESRRAADWLNSLGLCHGVAILSDDLQDVVWTCRQAKPDLLVLEAMPDAMERLDDPHKDIAGRCELAAQIMEALPDCRVYLTCAEEFQHLEPVMQKAVETDLIRGYCFGGLTGRQLTLWLEEKPGAITP